MDLQTIRSVEGLNFKNLLEIGNAPDTVGETGETIPGRSVYYLPAKARLEWYNKYCFENNKIMPLDCEIIRADGGLVVIKATLKEKVIINNEEQYITIATGLASQFIENSSSAIETCETRAKGRCLGAAGFSLPCEYTLFDEGETPIDGALINRRTVQKDDSNLPAEKKEAEESVKPKKKRGRPKKVKETSASEGEIVAEKSTKKSASVSPETDLNTSNEKPLPIPSIEKITNLVPENGPEQNGSENDDKIKERETLEKCLRAFFPYGQYKGQQVNDVITQKKFKDCIDKMASTDYNDKMVNDELSVNTLIRTLKKYLNLPTPEERLLLMELVSSIRQEDEEEF